MNPASSGSHAATNPGGAAPPAPEVCPPHLEAISFFDSLTHITADGSWLGNTRRDARRERLLAELEQCAPARACLVAIAGVIDNETVLETAKQHPDQFVPVGSINPVTAASEREIAKAVAHLAGQGFAGLKLHPRLNGYDPLDPKVMCAVRAAGDQGLVVFLDTLFRQPGRATRNAPDVVDALAVAAPHTHMILLHGGGSQLLAVSEVVAVHPHLTLDLSFTIHRFSDSSVEADLRFLMRTFDRRMVVGSDFPEYHPLATRDRVHELCEGLDPVKPANVRSANLECLLAPWFAKHRSKTHH
ncbi:MAG TPA: amidohydrolase family protein [Planctomycetaceae bacterium]|nr:amidohydrolase family protein [Planctomycetaceae bacterium]